MKKTIYFFTAFILFFSCSSDPDPFEVAESHFHISELDEAKDNYLNVGVDSEHYSEAQKKIFQIDSLNNVWKIERRYDDSVYIAKKNEENRQEIIALLDFETIGVDNFDVQQYIFDVGDIESKLSVFDGWKSLIERSRKYDYQEIQDKTDILESKIKSFSATAFPKLRKSYADLAKKLLWEQNIDVNVKGNKYTTIEFVGGLFASNKNIKDSQESLSLLLTRLRFKRVNYKFTKYDDEYTYYTINGAADNELPK